MSLRSFHITYSGVERWIQAATVDDALEKIRGELYLTTNRRFGLFRWSDGQMVTGKDATAEPIADEMLVLRPVAIGGG